MHQCCSAFQEFLGGSAEFHVEWIGSYMLHFSGCVLLTTRITEIAYMSGSDWCGDMQAVSRVQPDLSLCQLQLHLYYFSMSTSSSLASG